MSYLSPTPKKFRKLGDSLLGAGTMITTYSIMTEHKWLAVTSLVICVVGKFLTNFFSEDSPVEEEEEYGQ